MIANKMPLELADEKAQYVIPFILKELEVHQQLHADRDADVKPPPFILGMNGVQGAGKTILVRPVGLWNSSLKRLNHPRFS